MIRELSKPRQCHLKGEKVVELDQQFVVGRDCLRVEAQALGFVSAYDYFRMGLRVVIGSSEIVFADAAGVAARQIVRKFRNPRQSVIGFVETVHVSRGITESINLRLSRRNSPQRAHSVTSNAEAGEEACGEGAGTCKGMVVNYRGGWW